MNNYAFVTIHTLVDIGDGETSLISPSGEITSTANLARLVDAILLQSYPMMTQVSSTEVNLSSDKNKQYYGLNAWCGPHVVYTFKFTVEVLDAALLKQSLNGIPLVVSDGVIKRFVATGPTKNTTIMYNTFV